MATSAYDRCLGDPRKFISASWKREERKADVQREVVEKRRSWKVGDVRDTHRLEGKYAMNTAICRREEGIQQSSLFRLIFVFVFIRIRK